MHIHNLVPICCVALLLCLVGPATCAVTPLWVEPVTVGGELSGVVISSDGSTIIVGGDQLICLTSDGRKRWSGWSGTYLDISHDGDYIVASQGPVVRLISSAGRLVWEQSMEIPVTDVSIAQNASLVAANGGGRIRLISLSGEGIASNTSLSVNHIRIMPSGQLLVTTKRDVHLLDQKLLPDWSDTNSSHNLLAVAEDGSAFVTATNNRIRMYKGNGNLSWDKRITGENAEALAYSGDGSTIVIGTDHNNILVMNRNGANLWAANASNWITSVAVSNDGNTIVAGSLDKKIYVFNHAGSRLGIFPVRSAIRSNSIAVSRDGSLIMVVDDSAAYALSRSSFAEPATTPKEIITEPGTEPTAEPTTEPLYTPAIRKITRTPVLPTPYPTESETPESALPLAVPLVALGLLILCRPQNR